VTLGLCSQLELDLAVSRAEAKRERAEKRAAKAGTTILPVNDQPGSPSAEPVAEEPLAQPEDDSEA
jgi:hypothetical protein